MATKKDIGKKIWSIASTVLVVLVVLIAVFLMGSRILGFRVFNVISGSMEPTYSVGDLIYVKEIYPGEIKTTSQRVEKIERIEAMIENGTLKVGDPITFVMNDDLVVATHKIIEIDTENRWFKTQGEANETADAAPVKYENLIGKPYFAIPLVGYLSDAIQNPPGSYIAIFVVAILIVVVFTPDVLKLINNLSKKKKKGESEESEESVESEPSPSVSEETAEQRAELERLRAEIEAAKAELAAARGDTPETEEAKPTQGEDTPSEQ
jgi:signal peptidase